MSVGRGAPELPAETSISSGPMGLVDSFKYLGGIVNSQASLQEEQDMGFDASAREQAGDRIQQLLEAHFGGQHH
ncbi:unnamed protein product [Sphagnum jensenii]|uniref:Uncharacterized protein n=1 Tax=Sphagnum jensenii TaxID=128206 RepID=A0ABP1C1B0_9BRYO